MKKGFSIKRLCMSDWREWANIVLPARSAQGEELMWRRRKKEREQGSILYLTDSFPTTLCNSSWLALRCVLVYFSLAIQFHLSLLPSLFQNLKYPALYFLFFTHKYPSIILFFLTFSNNFYRFNQCYIVFSVL